jgi:hypothetical protein
MTEFLFDVVSRLRSNGSWGLWILGWFDVEAAWKYGLTFWRSVVMLLASPLSAFAQKLVLAWP